METIAFLLLVAVGAFVQTIAGFAMGLIIMGGVGVLVLLELEVAAAVVSIISLVNVLVALRRTYRFVDRGFLVAIVAGMLPLMLIGVYLLDDWSNDNDELLRTLLGVVIIAAGTLLMLKPALFQSRSGLASGIGVGAAAGLMGGLYGAGGAPVAYYLYRQPLLIQAVRATLLSTFAISTIGRTGVVAYYGHITTEVLTLTALSVPVVLITTLIGNRLLPVVPELLVRRCAFGLLILLGISLLASGAAGG